MNHSMLTILNQIDNIPFSLIGILMVLFFVIIIFIGALRRYKRCPSDRILVVYGKVGKGGTDSALSSRCVHGGAAFVWPVFQDYAFMDLTPLSIEVDLAKALSRQNIRVNVPSRFTVGISTEPGVMTNAAERLLGLGRQEIHDLAKDIIFGQLRLVIATMDIEEINSNRDKFLANVASNVEAELKKIGLKLINVNVTDITDESGYIEALGKEAAAKAINDAKKSVAEQNRDGSIGEANAVQDQRVQVADANATANIGEASALQKERVNVADANAMAKIGEATALQKERVSVADANARAIEGENTSKIDVAKSDASRREEEAEAHRRAIAAEKVKEAKALEEAYQAQKLAEDQRAERDRASKKADVVVPAEIEKQKIEIDAEAEAERIRRLARGEADAIFAKLEAEARGTYEVLSKQAEGFRQLVSAAGNDSNNAVMIMIADKLPELVRLQSDAIKNIKIDKVTVWDGQGGGKDGKTSTANFLSGIYKSVPPLEDMFNMAGMQLPKYLKGESMTGEHEAPSGDFTTDSPSQPSSTNADEEVAAEE
jgi:flotillin